MPAELPLERVQRWMLEVVTQPGSVHEALRAPSARREIEPELLHDVILPSRRLSSEQRIGIYHDMYMLRIVEALEFDYPGVAQLLGHARFYRLVEGYVGAFPSRSYTLNRLGDHFPEYIASLDAMPRRALLADLARFELAITLAFDAAQSATLSPEAILSVPAEAWAEARFRTIDALQLLRVDYPVDDYLQSIKQGGTRPPLRKATKWILVFRSELSVRQVALSKREWTMLEALREGLTLPDAVDRLSAFRPRISETELFTWFREWTRMGLFSAIELPGS